MMDIDLRIILLIVGALFIVGLIVADNLKRKRTENLPYKRFTERQDFELPSMKVTDDAPHHDAFDGLGRYETTVAQPAVVDEPHEYVADPETKTEYQSAESGVETATDLQAALESERATESEPLQDEPAEPPPPANPGPEMVLSLLILAPKGEQFRGSQIKMALHEAGFTFGKMDIFHQLVGDEPLVSVANVIEPGTFVLEELADFRTPGLVVFSQLPAPLAGEELFGKWYKAAKKINAVLGGRLADLNQRAMAREDFDRLQQQAGDVPAVPSGSFGE